VTQILTFACPLSIVQVSDRLLTALQQGKSREFDPIANKTLVYRANDALVSIGYSGIAYIDNMPTEGLPQILLK
jgi:hypothetical protein